jgi:hypothetical protein
LPNTTTGLINGETALVFKEGRKGAASVAEQTELARIAIVMPPQKRIPAASLVVGVAVTLISTLD